MTILQLVINEPDIRGALIGVPLYLHTMITYAAVFLLKMQQQWKAVRLGTDSILIRDTVDHVIKLLNETRASDRHLSYHIANGLRKMLERLDRSVPPNRERPGDDVHQLNGAHGEIGQVVAGSAFPSIDAGYDLGAGYGSLPIYGESPEMFDESYFPIGFFDVTAIGGPWQWQSWAT
jgi:hypothetical protein